MVAAKPQRSVLFLPGDNARAQEKARQLPADVVVFDLEDAVAPERKAEARQQIRIALHTGGFGPRALAVRVNHPGSRDFAGDVAALEGVPFAAVVLPKIESVQEIDAAHHALAEVGHGETPLWCMIETPLGIVNAAAIARHSRTNALLAGTNDLGTALNVPVDAERFGLISHLSTIVVAARAAGVMVFDGVYPGLEDAEGLTMQCRQGRALGFDGKSVIHPNQLPAANACFTPDDAIVEQARTIVTAYTAAMLEGKEVIRVGKQMVERLHYEAAQRLLATHAAIVEYGW